MFELLLADASTFTELAQPLQGWANDILVWIGFGTLVGLLAKAIMPGRDPGGAVATLAMGIGGTVIGCGLYSLILDGQRITPVSWGGFLVGVAGAFVLLCFYRLLGGYWFTEGEVLPRHSFRHRGRRKSSRRRYSLSDYDE